MENGERRARLWRFLCRLLGPAIRYRAGLEMERLPEGEAAVVVCNHVTNFDPVFLALASPTRPLTYVASEHILRDRPMLRKLLLIFAILSTLFSVIAAIVLLVITVRPIRKMTDEMSRIIDTGAFETGAPPVNSMIHELDTLGHLFNVMTEKYANLIRAMRLTMDNVAHDFRTPLTRIRGGCELAITRGDLPKGLADTLADVIEDCDRAKMQLQNLMDTREMEIGFSQLSLESIDYCELLSGLADMYSLIAEEKEIRLLTDFPDVPVTGMGDRQRLMRVFANLLDNAVKYTPRRGEVSLSLRQENGNVVVCVADTGIGIPEEERGLIWQRLFRGKKASESEKGLGLGLNIVQVTVAAHHGTIRLVSEEGKGTKFTVMLPVSPGA